MEVYLFFSRSVLFIIIVLMFILALMFWLISCKIDKWLHTHTEDDVHYFEYRVYKSWCEIFAVAFLAIAVIGAAICQWRGSWLL